MAGTTIKELPTDILYLIFSHLTAQDFLNFTCSSGDLALYRQDATFWRTLTKKTFRISSSPLLQADGNHWQRLYKRLLTQTKLFTWGNDDRGSLGSFSEYTREGRRTNGTPRSHTRHPRAQQMIRSTGYPRRPDIPIGQVGIVIDVQCGGWSTTVLNSLGILFLLGTFDGQIGVGTRDIGLKQLAFPPGYPPTTESRYEPSTAIQQFSVGRNHVLGLSDDGKVWFWAMQQAMQLQFMFTTTTGLEVKRVVAGWDRSSVCVEGVGIAYWQPELYGLSEGEDVSLITPIIIPDTDYERDSGRPDSKLGEVTCHIVLEGYIVFTTDENRLFAHSMVQAHDMEDEQTPPVELTTFYSSDSSSPFVIRDLQGSFRSFAVFTASGGVLIGSRSLIDDFFSASTAASLPATLPEPTRITSLQNRSVVSLAFGDYHIHALHSNGTLSSFGTDPATVGAFGLGPPPLCLLRGTHAAGNLRDVILHGDERRTVWFDPLMEKWLQDSLPQAQHRLTLAKAASPIHEQQYISSLGNYFELQGSRWGEDANEEDNEVPAYFALKVSAAGWHSAALVLVDDEKAERARQKHILQQPGEITDTLGTRRRSHGTNDSSGTLWEMLAIHASQVYAHFVWLMRWFLGLTARDAAAAERRADKSRVERAGDESTEQVIYAWEDQILPELPSEIQN